MAATGEEVFSGPVRVRSQNRFRWDLSPEQIQKMSDDLISKMKAVFGAVSSLDLDDVTFDNTLKALANVRVEYMILRNILNFNQRISSSERLRTTSKYVKKKLNLEFEANPSRDEDIYPRIVALSSKADIDSLTSEDKRWMEETLRSGKVLHLPKAARDEIKNISTHLYKACKEHIWANFKKAVKLHARMSALLGYETYADYVLSRSMAQSAEKVSTFLDELARKLKPLGDKERAVLLKLKKERCQKRRLPFNGKLYERDLPIYKAQVIKEHYGVDHHRLKEYFPLEVVTQGLLGIYQDLLGLSFSLVDAASVWHPDVTLYSVTDQSSQQTIGQFYLDLVTRKGKHSRGEEGICLSLQPACLLSDGSRQIPVAAIVTHFYKRKSTPCLLYHQDVLTYFHEFGHAMHYLCGQVEYADFNSFMVEMDFVEAPSQMCENWAWEKETLRRVSKHYKTGAPIPDDLLDKLIKSRLANRGMVCLGQIIRAKVDQALHTQAGLHPGKEYARLTKEILGVHASQRTNRVDMLVQALYDCPANHYRYLWGEVLAMDMFYSRFKQEGIMNPKVGLDYRECILKPGASKDAEEMLKNFLGREPNQEAFLLSKGLTTLETRKRKLEESHLKKRKRN